MNDSGKVTYRQQYSLCGKPGCRKCSEGKGHGPYWYAYRNVNGRTVRTYIGKHLPPGVDASASPHDVRAQVIAPTLEQADQNIANDNLPKAIELLERLLADDPASEAAAQRMMIALARSKRRGESLQAYQRLSTLLRQRQQTPTPQTQAIYEAIQRGENIANVVARFIAPTNPIAPSNHTTTSPATSTTTDAAPNNLHPSVPFGRSNQSPFVGRESELAALRALLLAAESQRRDAVYSAPSIDGSVRGVSMIEAEQRQCMILLGESGIGKTRLAEELGHEAQQRDWAVIWSHSYAQESGIPYRLWTEALRRLKSEELWPEEDLQARQHIYQPLLALLPELQELATLHDSHKQPDFYQSHALSPDLEPLRLREAVYELLTAISATKPLLLVLDDVQWADGSSCELLGYLARRLHGYPLVLLCTCRENELSNNKPLHSLIAHMQREHAVETLHIQPLNDTQIASLVAYLPPAMVQRIQTQAAGNPFFAEELAHSFQEARKDTGIKATAMPHDTAQLWATEEDIILPGAITAALDQRLRRLSSDCRQLLGKAAVLGGSFEFTLLLAMETENTDTIEDTLLDLLEEALRASVLAEESVGRRTTYRFWHPLVASYLYTILTATRRTRLHRRAAEALKQAYREREEEQAAAIVQHMLKGGTEPAQIAHYAEMAANHAYLLSAYPEAERHYRIAIDHLNVGAQVIAPDDRLRLAFLLERLAECVRVQGNFKEARRLFERVLEMRGFERRFASQAESLQEAQIQSLLWSEIGWTWRYTGDTAQARRCCERGEQVLRRAGITSGSAWARLRFQQASLSWQEGNYEEARNAAEESLRLFSADQVSPISFEDVAHQTLTRRFLQGGPVEMGRTHALLGALASAIGQQTESLRQLNIALQLYEQHDRQREIAHVCCNIGYLYLKKAEYDQSRSFLHRSLDLAERIGDTPLTSVIFHNLGEIAASSGDLSEAELLYRRALMLAEQVDDREYLSLWNADLAGVLQEKGDLAAARASIYRALSLGRAMRNIPCTGNALLALGNLHFAQAQSAAQQPDSERMYLLRAKAALQRVLSFQKLEIETRIRARIAIANTLSRLGDAANAHQQATLAQEEASRHELLPLLARARTLM